MKLYDDRLHQLRKKIKGLYLWMERGDEEGQYTGAWIDEATAIIYDLEGQMATIKPCLWTLFLRLFGVR